MSITTIVVNGAEHYAFELSTARHQFEVEPQQVEALALAARIALTALQNTALTYGDSDDAHVVRRTLYEALRPFAPLFRPAAPFVPPAGTPQPATRPEPAGSTAGGPMEHRPESGGDACDVRGCGGQPVYLYSVGVPAPTYPLFLCVHHANELALCGINMKPVRKATGSGGPPPYDGTPESYLVRAAWAQAFVREHKIGRQP